MMLRAPLCLSATLLFATLFLASGCGESRPPPPAGAKILSDDGAWCWYQDPRAVFLEGQHRRTYAAWMSAGGDLMAGMVDHDSGATLAHVLKKRWGVDDHNTASFLPLVDGRLMAFYTRHNAVGLFARVTQRPEDITAWGEEITISSENRTTYSHPVYLSEEDRYYVFWRGPSWKPTFATSNDGIHWSAPHILLQDAGRAAQDIRPYLKVSSDGVRSIHLAFTDGHPRVEATNSIYYARYEAGAFYRADNTRIGSMDALPFAHRDTDVVYDARATKVRAWIWDVAIGSDGAPVIAYTRLPTERDHRYHYARWSGNQWNDHEMVAAGPWFPQTPAGKKEREGHYSGGITLHPSNPNVVYLSRPVQGVFEIERWITADGGVTWQSRPITQHSNALNVRPVVPRGSPADTDHVLWMNGRYVHYTDYNTRILFREQGLQSDPAQKL